jgi:hypothetical protein
MLLGGTTIHFTQIGQPEKLRQIRVADDFILLVRTMWPLILVLFLASSPCFTMYVSLGSCLMYVRLAVRITEIVPCIMSRLPTLKT